MMNCIECDRRGLIFKIGIAGEFGVGMVGKGTHKGCPYGFTSNSVCLYLNQLFLYAFDVF